MRPRVVVLAGGDEGGGATGSPTAASASRRRFVGFFAALRKAVRLPLLSVSRDFCAAAVARSCCFRSFAATRSAAFASRSFFLISVSR